MTERDDHEPAATDPSARASAARPANRLAAERSPYLLQHAHDPVDWYPWGEEAFARARREDLPVFLSIGYSTCHWCHVMERESFADEGIAALLNRHFVPVKVDREERPDVDRLYMSAAQALGLGGGWPLSLFLTPALAPFHGGTYFPPAPRRGLPAFGDVLEAVRRAWAEQRARIEEGAGGVLQALEGLDAGTAPGADDRRAGAWPTVEELAVDAFLHFEHAHDRAAGGFGHAPKFPAVANLDFLLVRGARDFAARRRARDLVVAQLDAMQAGGIHDQLGGGFHRYATDPLWRVPHFEKMLYDQAQLAWIYLDAHILTGRADHAATARGVLDYVARDLTSPDGAFYCGEDADSEGEEGRFYAWTPAQTAAALGAEAELFDFAHGVTAAGDFAGGSVPRRAHTPEETARHFGLGVAEAAARLAAARARLLEARRRRVRPQRDEKVLTAWNGLMIAAFARGAVVLEDPALAARAARAAEFVWAALRAPGPEGLLLRRWCAGESAGAGQLADHAGYAFGLVALHQATQDPRWLVRAAAVAGVMAERFQDARTGGFFESPPGDPFLRVRLKESFDGAEIAGASLALLVLHQLGGLLERDDWRERAVRAIGYYRRRLAGTAWAMPRMLAAMELAAAPPRHVVVAGRAGAADTRALAREFGRRFLPGDLLLVVEEGERRRALAGLGLFAASLERRDGRAAAYVCVGHACRAPVTEPRELGVMLDEETKS
jgi:uncharacterized protein YyaL (SSP411 family)